MKICTSILGISLILLFCACGSDSKESKNQSQAAEVSEPLLELHDEETYQELTYPEPGSGTITSITETPLAKQNKAQYQSTSGKSLLAIYYFDNNNMGIVVLQNGESDDITLYQIKDDYPTNYPIYTNGKITWEASSNFAVWDDGNEIIEYKLVGMTQ